MCGSAEVGLQAQVKSVRFPLDTGIGIDVAVIGIDVGVSSVVLGFHLSLRFALKNSSKTKQGFRYCFDTMTNPSMSSLFLLFSIPSKFPSFNVQFTLY